MNRIIQLLETYIHWLRKKLSAKQFLIFASILVGLTAGSVAVFLKMLVHYIRVSITKDFHIECQQLLYFIFPTIGILITAWIIKKYFKGNLEKGTAYVLFSISKRNSFLAKHLMYSNAVTSALTVGLGGSVGLESPIVSTGAAIGSNFSKNYHLSSKERTLLLACGVSAGISAAFNAPIAGVLFALEVLLADVSIAAFIPIMISSVTGGLLSLIILNEDILLSFKLDQKFNYTNVPFYAVLGVLAAVVSVYYIRVFLKIEYKLNHSKIPAFTKALVGGISLSVLILLFPPLFGEGYETIKSYSSHQHNLMFSGSILNSLVNNNFVLVLMLIMLLLLKPIAAAVTIGSGGNGGNFAPSLFVGATLGFCFSIVLKILGFENIPSSNFTLVAMAGILSGVFHAPLTGIFLIAELTGGYELMIPLMLVSALSYAIARYFEPYSLDTKNLALKGYLVSENKDSSILESINTMQVVENNFQTVAPQCSLRELLNVVSHSKRNIFPVVEQGKLKGIILLDDIREIMFNAELYDTTFVNQLMHQPPAIVSLGESLQSVMKKFDDTLAWNLPVIDENEIYLGFVSKSGLLVKYREKLLKSY